MKTKLSIIVVVLIALLFMGCDQILESYYGMDEGGEVGWTNGEFKIELILEEINTFWDAEVGPNSPIIVGMLPYYQEGDGYFNPAPWDAQHLARITDPAVLGFHEGGSAGDFVYTEIVPPGKYNFAIWHDINDDGKPGWEEPSRLFEYYIEEDYNGYWDNFFDLFNQDAGTIEAWAWMWENDRMPEDIMQLFNDVSDDEFVGDVFEMWIDGPMVIDSNNPLPDARYYINTMDTTILNVDWRIQLYGSEVGSGYNVIVDGDINGPFITIDWAAIDAMYPFNNWWDDYELFIDVQLENNFDFNDVQWRSRSFFIPVLPELADGQALNLNVDMWDLHMDPVQLDFYTAYDVSWSLWDGHPEFGGSFATGGEMVTTVYQGWFNEILDGLSNGIVYNSTSQGGTFIEIIIDKNLDGIIGNPGDWFGSVPVIAQNLDTTAWVSLDPWAFFPIN